MLSAEELHILSFYRASELAGSMLLGKLALHTNHDHLRVPLTEQCLEEAKHAWMLTQTIDKLGAVPTKITQTYQSELGKVYGFPESTVDILCLTRVLEVVALETYQRHVALRGVTPAVKETLEAIIEDEVGHIDWIQAELEKYAGGPDGEKVKHAIAASEAASKTVSEKFYENPLIQRYLELAT
ncbi:MAG: ferritin-like domain-containing protein [Chloroflexi bacterium]|nr:MAG: ferritin-like domain-containing protein [Chloroflexota bacterium]